MTKNCILKSNPKFQKIAAIYTVPIAEILIHKYNEGISGEELFYPEVKTLNTWITQSKTEQIKNLREILDSETGLTTKALVSLLQGIVSKYEGVYMVTRGNLHGGGLVNRAFHEEFTFGTNLRLMQELERDYPQHFEVVPVPKNKYSYIVKINPARLSKPTVEQLKLFNVENSNQLGVTSKQHLEQLFENNTELTAKAVLNNIKKAQPHLKNLVNKLESLVSENTIVSLDESTGYSTPFGTANAYFNKVNGNIGIAKNALFSKTPEAVILHEILHAVSHDKLKIDDNANYQFNLLLEYVTDQLGLENFEYALQNRDEFLAAVLTDPAFAEALSSIKAIDSKNQNIFEQIINYILKLINTTKIDNAYDQAVSLINEILELQSDNTVSPGVSEVFKMAPELASIGTPEQYSQYLNTIFPNSLIKDIVFHGTGYGEKITSLRNRSYFSTLDTASEYAAWDESNRIEYAFSQGLPESEIKAKAQLVPALINLINPKRLDGVNYKETEKDYPGHDGIYSENTVDPLTGNELQIVVFDSKNTHVLGSKQDIQKFKDFVNKGSTEVKEGVQEVFESNPELANQVYEALGFDSNEFSLVLKQEVESPEGIMLGEYNIVHKNNIIGNVFLPIGFKNYTIKGISFKEQYLNKGLGKAFYKWLGNKADIENATLHSDFDNTSESAKRVWESLKKENLAVDTQMGYKFSPKNLKQQALEAYSQYLDTIFPDSQVKDIVYHGSLEKVLNLKNNLHVGTKNQAESRILNLQDEYDKYDVEGKIYPLIVNLKSFNRVEDAGFNWSDVIKENKNVDGVVYSNTPESVFDQKILDSYLVFDSKNIHILGSKQDIEGFKDFVNKDVSKLYNVEQTVAFKENIGYKIYNKAVDANLSQFEIDEIFNNYVRLIDRKRKGFAITKEKFEKLAFSNLSLLDIGDSKILGEWDSENNVFKGRVLSSKSIRTMYNDILSIKDSMNFMASVPPDMGVMLDKAGFVKAGPAKPFTFERRDDNNKVIASEKMEKTLYFSSKEIAEKVFNKPLDKISLEEVISYDTYFNKVAILTELISNIRLKKPINTISKSLKELSIYDYNAYKIVKKYNKYFEKSDSEKITKVFVFYTDLLKNNYYRTLTNEQIESSVKSAEDAALINKTEANELLEIVTVLNNLLITIDMAAANKDVQIDTLTSPKVYDELNNKLNKTLVQYLDKFGFSVKSVEDIQSKLGIDSFATHDILNKIIQFDKDNQTDLPEKASEVIVYMMQYNPIITEIMSYMDQKSMFRKGVLSKEDKLKAIADLLNEQLHLKTKTSLPESLVQKLKLLFQQFLNMLSKPMLNRVNRKVGEIANQVLLQNQSLITASLYKPGAFGQKTTPVSLDKAMAKDKFGAKIINNLSPKGFILTGSTALGEQGLILRPDENLLHDIDWISPFNRSKTKELFLSSYPDAVFVRDIISENYTTDSWLIAPENHKITDYKIITTESGKIIIDSYNIRNNQNEIVGTYVLEEGKEIVEGIQGKVIDFFTYETYTNQEPFIVNNIKLAHWTDIFKAKLEFARYKDIWDYNRFVPTRTTDVIQKQESLEDTILSNPDTIYVLEADEQGNIYTTETGIVKLDNYSNVHLITTAVDFNSDKSFTPEESKRIKDRLESDLDILEQISTDDSSVSVMDNNIGTHLAGKDSNLKNFLDVRLSNQLGLKRESSTDSQLVEAEESDLTIENIDSENLQDEELLQKLDPKKQEEAKSIQFVTEIVDRLIANLGMPEGSVNFITAQEAKELTANAKNPYNGEPAFFYKGKIYFVDGQFNFSTAIHEISHPFIKSIRYQNPQLFNKLFNDLYATETGKLVAQESTEDYYDNFNEEVPEKELNDDIKEETIVRFFSEILEAVLNDQDSQIGSSPKEQSAIAKIIMDILYALKKLFRQVVGKGSKIEKLKADTTLKELANLLATEQFQVDMDIVSQEDIVDYINNQKKLNKELRDVLTNSPGRSEIFKAVNETSVMYRKLLDELRKNGDIFMLNAVLEENWDGSTLVTDLAKAAGEVKYENVLKKLAREENALEEIAIVGNNIVRILAGQEKILENVKNRLDYLSKQSLKNDKLVVNELNTYRNHLKNVLEFTESFSKIAEEIEIDEQDEIFKEIRALESKAKRRLKDINKIHEKIILPVLKSVWDSYMGATTIQLKSQKEKLEKALQEEGAYKAGIQRSLNNINDQLSKIDLGLEAFKEHAFGKRGDINPLSSWFESYIAQQDPTIASFAAYVKGELSDAQNEEYARFNSLRNKLKALEKELGISPSDINKYAEEFLTADVVKISNDQDELIDFEVYALLNPFKNTENTLRGMYVNIENLRDKVEEGEPGALEELEKAEAKLKLHKALFYNNEMVDEYYFVDNTLLTNPDVDGASLLAKVNEKQTEMKALHSQRMVTNDALELKVLQDEIKQKRFEIKELYSDYSNGVKKTAQELKDAKALREWREAKSKYYDFALKKGDFEKALSGYEQTVIATLENQNLDQETINEILAEKRKEWISQNTRVVIKQDFYDKKARYLETLNSINEQIEESLQKDKTISDMVGSSVYYNNKLYKVSYKNGEYLFTRENEDPISFDVDATTLINSLGAKVPTRKIFDLNREYIFQSLLGKKDENGEYMVTELSEEHLAAIKEMQEEIEKDKEFLINNNGLTSAEMRELSGYFEIRQRGEQLASKDFNRYKELLDKKNKFKIDPALKRQLLVYSRLLNELQTKEASSYYIDYLNDNFYDLFLSQDLIEQGEIRLDNIESILNIEVANALMEASPEFKEWFEKNHYIAEVYVEDGVYEEMYQRIEPWNKTVPTDPADYESFQITRQDGSEETIPGLPTTDYYQRELKNEYKLGYNPQTGKIENSQYKDISNKFTPKNLEQMQEMVKKYPEYFANSEYTWDHYINKKYYDVMEAGGPKAEILKAILEYHQESQKGLDDNQMLGYYLPRFRADLYENLTSDDRESIGDRLSEFWEKTASQFMVRKDDYQESSFNFAETVYAADKIVYRTDSEKIPIQGKYLLEKKQVSRDVFHVLGAYALSAAENKRLKKSNHMARFLQTVAAENKPYDKIQTNSIKDQAKQKIKNNKMLLSGKDNFRSATIDAMVESIYEGKQIATDSPLYTSIAKFTQPLTSIGVFSFFAFDLHSAFKNYLGARSMVALESINSRFFSYKSHLMATPWAHKVMLNISNEIYTKGANSLEVQMMMAFDAFQGRFKQKFATSPGRKFARDLVNFTWTSNTRQYLEIATNVETFAAILHHVKLEQETPEGKKTIRYVDAWELNPETKTLQLKPGIDKKYDIDGEEFIKVKAAAQEHNNFAQGVYAQFDSTRIERTVYGSMSMRMKKFFIKMAINRFSGAFDGDRTNLATGRVESGFYVKAVKTLKRLIQSGGKDFNYLQADEKKAMIQTLVDLLKGYILYEVILLGMMLGFDFDDEDRFKKMRERSGALPTPFTDPEHSENWNFSGWFNNNLALLLLNTHEEVTFFHTPKSVIGTAKEWSPVTEGSAAEAVISIGKDLVDGLNPWAGMDVYSRTVGGLNVQQKNEYKIWMKIYKLVGLKGKAIDPVTQMKNKSTMRRLKTGAKKQEEEENEE